jgi:Na+/H+-dicarboxylate symporter
LVFRAGSFRLFYLGYSFNLDGSTCTSVGSIFVAQARVLHLSVCQQITMMLALMLTSKDMAAFPSLSSHTSGNSGFFSPH